MIEPCATITDLLTTVAATPAVSEGMRVMAERTADFEHPLAAQLTRIALDPHQQPRRAPIRGVCQPARARSRAT